MKIEEKQIHRKDAKSAEKKQKDLVADFHRQIQIKEFTSCDLQIAIDKH